MGLILDVVEGLGDLATWLGSLGTIAAFIVAFWQIRRERVERKSRERRVWHRAHAEQVSAWIAAGHLVVTKSGNHPVDDVVVELESGPDVSIAQGVPGTTEHDIPAE